MPRSKILSGQAMRTEEPPINHLMAIAVERPELTGLAAGFADKATLPAEEVLGFCREIFAARTVGLDIDAEGLRADLLGRRGIRRPAGAIREETA